MACAKRNRVAAGLIELIIVISLIGVLVGLLLPAVQAARGHAARTACSNCLRQIGVAVHQFHATHGRVPPATPGTNPYQPDYVLSWQVALLPHLEQDALHAASVAACAADPIPLHTPPHVGRTTAVKVYLCAADGRLGGALTTPRGDFTAFTSYLAVGSGRKGEEFLPGVLSGERPGCRLDAVMDGTSQTVMVGERPPPDSLQAGQWYAPTFSREPWSGPNSRAPIPGTHISPHDTECAAAGTQYGPGRADNPCDRLHFWSLHAGGANWLFADGAVSFLPYSARDVMPQLATRAGGEAVPIP